MKNLLKVILLLSILLLCTQVNSQEYYADLTFEIHSDGMTDIIGTTNYPSLDQKSTQELTSKEGNLWIINIDTNNVFSEYSYKILLPEGAKIQKIETLSTYFIQNQNERILVDGYGEGIELKLKINYTIKTPEQNNFLLIIAFILGILLIFTILFLKFKTKKQFVEKKEEFDSDTLTERQLAIVKEIEKKNGKNTQAEIQKTLNLPKASLFRNIHSLEKKGIITKERKGMTMLLILKKNRRN